MLSIASTGPASVSPEFVTQQRPGPALHIDTRGLPKSLQYAAWVEQVGPIIETVPELEPERGFAVELDAWDLGGLLLIEVRTPRAGFDRTVQQARSDGLDHWVLTAVRRSGEGTLNLTCLNLPFSGRSSGSASVHLCVPRDFLRHFELDMDGRNGMAIDSQLGRLLAEYLLNLAARMHNVEPIDYGGLRASIRMMIVACLKSAGSRPIERHPVQASLLERARRMVHQRLYSPTLGVEELCAELAVSRSRLYRMFEPLGGVVRYIRQRRLLDAHIALADAENPRPIVEIAAERGFIDPAEFSRAFKREFGYRPSDARVVGKLLPYRRQTARTSLASLLGSLN